MHAKFSTEFLPTLAKRLFRARKTLGISTRAAAELAGPRLQLSHATIANYEKGRSTPPANVLAALASVYGRPIGWFLDEGETLSGIRYRNLTSKVRIGERQRYEACAEKWLEAYIRLETHLDLPLEARSKLPSTGDLSESDAAESIRSAMKLDDKEPVPSVTNAMERFGIRVVELPTESRIDGLAARYGEEFVVVLNPDTSNDRARMNAAHETIHVAEGDCEKGDGPNKEQEQRAFNVASRVLLPECQLKEAFRGKSLVRLVSYKERFGISLAAMIYRAQHTDILSASEARWLWMEFSRRGWRRKEPGYVRPDRAIRFEEMLDSAILERRIKGFSEAETILGVAADELRERLKMAMGIKGSREQEEGDDDSPPTIRLVR